MKRIAFTVTNDLQYDQRMHRICTTLAKAGYSVTLIGRRRSEIVHDHFAEYERVRLKCHFQKGIFFYIEYQIKLFIWLCSQRYDIISSVDSDTLLACTLASIIHQKPLVFDAHEYFTEVPELTGREAVKNIWHFIENICMPLTVKRYTVSHELAKIFSVQHHVRFEIIYNVPEHQNLNQTAVQKNSVFTMVYQGDVNPGRGIDTAIKALQQLNVHLLIIGDGPEMPFLKHLAETLQVLHKVTFTGYKPYHEMQQLTQRCDLGLNLLDATSLSYYYSLSNKFFNYIHAGIPQLCADFPEYRKIYADYRVAKLINNTVDDLVAAVNELMQNPQQLHQMKLACSAAAAYYCWQNMQNKLIAIYDSIG